SGRYRSDGSDRQRRDRRPRPERDRDSVANGKGVGADPRGIPERLHGRGLDGVLGARREERFVVSSRLAEPYGGPLWEVEGAVDMHCHPYPDLFPRVADDHDIVSAAKGAGMRAVVLKCHHESTVSRAYHMRRAVPGINVYGGIVLNSYVGYLNP